MRDSATIAPGTEVMTGVFADHDFSTEYHLANGL